MLTIIYVQFQLNAGSKTDLLEIHGHKTQFLFKCQVLDVRKEISNLFKEIHLYDIRLS